LLENHRDALDGLKEEKFEIVFAEQLDLCGTALKEALKIKTHLWISRYKSFTQNFKIDLVVQYSVIQ
jgi:hypothetical protein